MIELINKRKHNIKVFDVGDGTRKLKASSGNLHYFNGENYIDVPKLPFPEGKLIKSSIEAENLVEIPKWGRAELEEDGDIVRIYDKKNIPIYRFHSPSVIADGEKGFELYEINQAEEDETFLRNIDHEEFDVVDNKTKIKKPNKDKLIKVKFKIKDGKIGFDLPIETNEALRVYDDTDTASTNNKNLHLWATSPTTNKIFTQIHVQSANYKKRSIISWTLPSETGTISAVKMYLYKMTDAGGWSTPVVEVHELSDHTGWVENQATWNAYSTGNNWTTAGGDYSSTIIDTTNSALSLGNYGWENWDLGTGATNPISGLDWGDTIHLLLKETAANEGTNLAGFRGWYSRSESSETDKLPYLEITYTPSASAFVPRVMMY